MVRFGTINFDDSILDALSDDRLVIFAGAGVSMGQPSNLPDLGELTSEIARGTGLDPSEPLDRFLGRLYRRDVDVHARAAEFLSRVESDPNELHHNLLRLFRTKDRVKLVTTNFDQHFEKAADTVFGAVPDVYQAPALPRGYNFSGIVHVHGALPHAQNLVLTDEDFGRAYLTEGWARNFLVDVFSKYTVLFVGYSYNDVVLYYLTRALSAGNCAGRFALTDEVKRWKSLGITPIHFMKGTGENSFQELYDGVKLIAERTTRGALEWQSRLAEIGSRAPPTDEEAIGEIEQALREVDTTQFLLDVARDPEWLRWLNSREHLDTLFGTAILNERDLFLAEWLAQHFAIKYPHDVFEIIMAHGLRLCTELWYFICYELGVRSKKPLEESALKRWTYILLANIPTNVDRYDLPRLAKRCAMQGCIELTLTVFMAMSKHQLSVKHGLTCSGDQEDKLRQQDVDLKPLSDYYHLDVVWKNYLRPHLARIAQQLLSGLTFRLAEMYRELMAWDKASRDRDLISYRRSAIEPHYQDKDSHNAIDVLIDAARDTLEWIAKNSPDLLDAWIQSLIFSDAPLLRRLAIHAITVHPTRSSDERLKWLLDHTDLNGFSEHHEIRRAVAQSYKDAANSTRKSFVDTILAHTLPASNDWSAEELTAYLHFDWLSWFLQAKPDCELAIAALELIKAQYPDFRQSDHSDFRHWWRSTRLVRTVSPWSVEELLTREPLEQLDDLLSFTGNLFDLTSREELLSNCVKACRQNTSWAFSLGHALADRAQWSSDLWSVVIQGMKDSDLPAEGWRDLLTLVSNSAVQLSQANDIAKLLYALVKGNGKPFALDLLEQANVIALSLWQALEDKILDEDIDNWVSRAINCPSGIIVEFWILGLSLLMNDKTGVKRAMSKNYFRWFTLVVRDETSKGGMGRCVLASQTEFLLGLDEAWTRQHIIPLFSDPDKQKFAQAWDGFLMHRCLNLSLANVMLPAFKAAMPRFAANPRDSRHKFIVFYISLATFYVSDPIEHLLPVFFEHGTLDDRLVFAKQLKRTLVKMEQTKKQQLWNSWLHRYWKNRLHGVPVKLDETEIKEMLEWLPHLGNAYPDAVALVIECSLNRIDGNLIYKKLLNSELVEQYPNETAKLLIYLAGRTISYHMDDLVKIEARLPPITAEVRSKLDEAFARAGVFRDQN